MQRYNPPKRGILLDCPEGRRNFGGHIFNIGTTFDILAEDKFYYACYDKEYCENNSVMEFYVSVSDIQIIDVYENLEKINSAPHPCNCQNEVLWCRGCQCGGY